MKDLLRAAILSEYQRISSDPVLAESTTTDSSRLIAATGIVATRALQALALEILHGGDAPTIASPCLRRSLEREHGSH
jgi:hypothetical protein